MVQRRGWPSGRNKPYLLPRTTSGVVTLNVCVAIKTLLEVPGPDELLSLNLDWWPVKISLLLFTSSISLPAFGKRGKPMRMLLQLTTLVQTTPHLSIHLIRQGLGLFIIHLWIRLYDLHQLGHRLLSGLEGPNAVIFLIRRTQSQ